MGRYINRDSKGNTLPDTMKVAALLADGAEPVGFGIGQLDIPFQPNLICVVDNIAYEAAAWIYDEIELRLKNQDDDRFKVWLTHPKAAELADKK